jgi:predicted RNA-binding protein with PIN domain
VRILVDGMNVVGTRPNGWWRDRGAAVRALLVQLDALVCESGDEVTVVLDGGAIDGLPEARGAAGSAGVVYARRRGRDAADDRIVELVSRDPDRETLTVVTSDRTLRRRVEELGAGAQGAAELLGRLDLLPPHRRE